VHDAVDEDAGRHDGFGVEGAELDGETKRRWAEARERLATLWATFDAYRRVIAEAERLRAASARPGPETLAELTGLLAGASVELKAEDVPVERRSLVRITGERISLDEAVARMDAAYQEVARTVAAADAAWSALLPRLDEAEAARNAAERLLAERPGLKVLFISGYSDMALTRQGRLLPGTALLQKPFTPGQLVRRVRELLDSTNAGPEQVRLPLA